MKKIIVFALMLILSATSFSQPVTNTAPTVKTDYLKKSGGQTTTAWMLLACGTAGLAGAMIAAGSFSIDIHFGSSSDKSPSRLLLA
ncbi:MAG: hypothetical protein IPQ06_09860 [Chitinophagaceae bacterium]|nr:hypothetical protein [Chitinophagaceae bacterium]